MKQQFIICDWANNLKFDGQRFESFEEASDFLTNHIELEYPEIEEEEMDIELGEFWIRSVSDFNETALVGA